MKPLATRHSPLATRHSPLATRHASLTALVGILMFGSSTALGRPTGYSGALCDVGVGDVCEFNGTHWRCVLDKVREYAEEDPPDVGGTAWMIYGETDAVSVDTCGNVCDGNPICAFGERDGLKFYCTVDEGPHSTMTQGWFIGSEYDDQLSFWYQEDDADCYLTNGYGTATMPGLIGKMFASGGADELYGSLESSPVKQVDHLYGESGDDEVYSYHGDDLCDGGGGMDTIHSGTGDDLALGGDAADLINLGPGTDVGRGGDGGDTVCGGPGDYDEMEGNANNDLLWDNEGSNDSADAGIGTDQCFADTVTSCESALTFDPGCPTEVLLYP